MTIKRFCYFLMLLLSVFAVSCSNTVDKFDKEDWTVKVSDSYKYREQMVKDLMENHLKEGLSYDYIINLLGEPDNTESAPEKTLWYDIKKEAGNNDEPGKMKTLFVSINNDSLVSGLRIEEWKFK